MLENVFTRLKHRINIERKLGLFVYVFLKKVFFPVLSLFFVYILGLKYLNILSKYMPKSKFKTNPCSIYYILHNLGIEVSWYKLGECLYLVCAVNVISGERLACPIHNGIPKRSVWAKMHTMSIILCIFYSEIKRENRQN